MSERERLFIGGRASEACLAKVTAKVQRLGIVTVASTEQSAAEETWKELAGYFQRHGVQPVEIAQPEFEDGTALQTIALVDGLYFAGGDQQRLMSVLTPAYLRAIKEVSVVAGSSAGTAFATKSMIYEGNVVLGAGIVDEDVIFDQHFSQRDRMGRLERVLGEAASIGIGIDEDTAIGIKGTAVEIYGKGGVYVVQRSPRGTGYIYQRFTHGDCFHL